MKDSNRYSSKVFGSQGDRLLEQKYLQDLRISKALDSLPQLLPLLFSDDDAT